MFSNGFPKALEDILHQNIKRQSKFAFVASKFELNHEKTDRYFSFCLSMFHHSDINFIQSRVIDDRMSAEQMRKEIETADVVWLAGGDTQAQFQYLHKYGLIPILRKHKGIIIGMSAGSINMAQTAICTLTCGHKYFEIYPALGLVDLSVEPHFDIKEPIDELLKISYEYPLHGLCDNGVIIYYQDRNIYIGDIYLIDKGKITKIS